jgi:hypothetical protein
MHRLKIQFLLSALLVEWKKKHRIICPYEINVKEFDTALSTCTQSDTPSTPPSSPTAELTKHDLLDMQEIQ